ncbi:hypothetical protein SAMN05428976_10748 [Clostridium sp. USBA 49]|uniref:hypothetical protein n=1 Tax=Clostridium TaxID=1485 RepID=UPI0009990F35|nr:MULTISPECIES: hypothetical protein [Clostridium]SKA85141.1 hypothetical protein SAMN05428976_10748 [Clostridium sp. USBA 49]
MSAFVLNRKYELQLPESFVDIDREEMEYVDGGGANYGWYGDITFRIARSVINAVVGVGATAAATAALASAGITGGLSTVVVPGLAGILGAVASNGLLKQDYYYVNMRFYLADYWTLRAISGFDNQITLAM